MGEITAADLANAVTAYATVLSGITTLLLVALMGRQPGRWVAVYAAIVVTGVPTVWYHGFGESFPAGVADIGTNLLLAWLLQLAVLGDYYSRAARRLIGGLTGALNLTYVLWRIVMGPAQRRVYILRFGSFGGFTLGEALLIAGSLLGVGLLYLRHARIPLRARPLWYATTIAFVLGALLASASNSQVDLRILAYHATWHVVGAFGFVLLWAFNHSRFFEAPAGVEVR
jgi:hypothetical protein